MVVKFTFQSVFGNSLRNPRHFSARGREESLELYSILWSDWPTSKQKVLRHGNRFAARIADVIFRRERSDDRKCVCLQARMAASHKWFSPNNSEILFFSKVLFIWKVQEHFILQGIFFKVFLSLNFGSDDTGIFRKRRQAGMWFCTRVEFGMPVTERQILGD